jgi:Mg2+ and Co2+ transporter CorA
MEICWVTPTGTKRLPDTVVREVASTEDGVLWVHLDHTDPDGMRLLPDLVPAHERDLSDCHMRAPVPTLRVYQDHYFSAMNGLVRGGDGRLHFQPLKIFLTDRVLFTVLGPHHETLSAQALRRDLDEVRRRLDEDGFAPATAFELGAAIRAEILRSHEELVAAAASRVATLELNVMRLDAIRTEMLLGDLFELRHDLQMIRTNAAQTYELFKHAGDLQTTRKDLFRLDQNTLAELRRGFDHLRKSADLEREYLTEVLDLFQTRVSTELNRFVRKITAFGTIGIAWTVIAGIYGMNFQHMPELGWELGYPGAIGVMALVGIVFAALFRRNGWL